ncbi:MurR/RpiR family transcriptional regulator [Nocardioides alkalitolerans]|uniref:MurR/RpiR family transcriptional regulator n=1 Tax=Nocardioides alkalitolerans TaxID=281714 RepID=UPI00040E7731|nr:MurR/RpiR family transcriptional regulator [Nocardioides alkalitolerans]
MTEQGQTVEHGRGEDGGRQWLVERCHSQRLSPTQRRVAQSFIDTMPDAAFLSTSEAALRAGVSQPTVTRFASTLGFSTYGDFRGALRQVILGGGEPPAAPGPDVSDPVLEAQANLGDLRGTLGSPAMAAAVRTLAEAGVLGIVGIRASAALASYVGYFARRVLDDVRVVTDGDAATDAITQMERAGGAALLVFAMPRYPSSTVRALRHARTVGVPTVLVVDTPFVDLANEADHVLVAPVGTGLVFDTHAAPVVLAMALLDGVAAAHPRRTQDRLEAHESLVDTWVHQPTDPDRTD